MRKRLISTLMALAMFAGIAVPALAQDDNYAQGEPMTFTESLELYAAMVTAAETLTADETPLPEGVRIHAVNDSDLGFHCRELTDGPGGASQKIPNYVKGTPVLFGQIAENIWLLVKEKTDGAGNKVFVQNTDYVCPKCGRNTWASYSNNNDPLGEPFKGGNIQINHYSLPPITFSGDVVFTKLKIVGGEKELAGAREFEFNLHRSNASGAVIGAPLNAAPHQTNDSGVVIYTFTNVNADAEGWYKFVEVSNPDWELRAGGANKLLFYLKVVGQTLVPFWSAAADAEEWANVEIVNVPVIRTGNLAITAAVTASYDAVTWRKIFKQDFHNVYKQDFYNVYKQDWRNIIAPEYDRGEVQQGPFTGIFAKPAGTAKGTEFQHGFFGSGGNAETWAKIPTDLEGKQWIILGTSNSNNHREEDNSYGYFVEIKDGYLVISFDHRFINANMRAEVLLDLKDAKTGANVSDNRHFYTATSSGSRFPRPRPRATPIPRRRPRRSSATATTRSSRSRSAE